jgi:cytochrome c biogenesis protein CcmG/thiol:disulfide interchange protein DsbE
LKNLHMRYRRAWVLGILLVILAVSGCSGVTEEQTNTQAASQNRDAAPGFRLQGLNQKTIDSSSVHKPMFVAFWATWCSFCQKEMPYFDKLAQEYKGRVEFAAINLTHQDSVKRVEAYMKDHKYQIPVYLDHDGKVTDSFQVLSIPTVILLDHQGRLAYKKVGSDGENGMKVYRDILNKLIEEINAQGG